MSLPPPWMVQVSPLREAPPVFAGLPMSAQVQTVGQLGGGGPPEDATCTWSKPALLNQCVSWESEKRPIVTGPLIDTVVLPRRAQLTPSLEYQVANVLPVRCSFSHLLGSVKPGTAVVILA